MSGDNELWGFSLNLYKKPGVADACIRLQDEYGADVNMLLAACYLGVRGYAWPEDEIRQLVRAVVDWRRQALLPLREVRRYLKTQSDAEALHKSALALEVDAEWIQQQRMWALLPALNPVNLTPEQQRQQAHDNLRRYLHCLPDNGPRSEPAALSVLLEQLTA